MPQEMSSGGMDGWTVHGEKPRRRGEEGGEEEKRAPANSECRLPISLRSPPSVTLKVKMLRRVSRNCPRLCPSRPGCWLPRCRRSARTWRDRIVGLGVGGVQPAGAGGFDPSVIDARARASFLVASLAPKGAHACTDQCANLIDTPPPHSVPVTHEVSAQLGDP